MPQGVSYKDEADQSADWEAGDLVVHIGGKEAEYKEGV